VGGFDRPREPHATHSRSFGRHDSRTPLKRQSDAALYRSTIEALVDPDEPPMPTRATLEQGHQFARALARGTREAGKILRTVLKDEVREMI
jgi:hypothetical protein